MVCVHQGGSPCSNHKIGGIRGDVVGILAWCGRDSGVVGIPREKGKARAVYLIAARIPPQIPPGPRPIGMPQRTKQPPTDQVAHIGPGAGKLKAGREPGERRLLSWQDTLGLASRARFLYY